MSLSEILKRLEYWNAGVLDPSVERDARAQPASIVAEAISQLLDAAAAYTPIVIPVPADPGEDRFGARALDESPWFMPMHEWYRQPTTYRFRALVFFVGLRRAHAAIAPLLEVVRTHAIADVRLIAGHGLVAIGDRAANEALGELSLAWTPGRFRLWCGTRFAIEGDASRSRSEAFEQIADRLACRESGLDDTPLVHAALDAANWHSAMDPRWGELAARALERDRRDATALKAMARVGDRRAMAALLAELDHPDHNTVLGALEKLHEMLGHGVVEVVMPKFRRTTHHTIYVDLFRRVGTPAALAALRDVAWPGSHTGRYALSAVLAADPSPPAWMQVLRDCRSSTLASRAATLEAGVRAAFAAAPTKTNRARFAAWVRTQPASYKSALFSLFDGEEPAWPTLQDRWERATIKRR